MSSACEPDVVVGKRIVGEVDECQPTEAGGGAGPLEKVVEVPWSTGFEDGFCDYFRSAGFCAVDSAASRAIVNAPVHMGQSAAAYSITTAQGARQSRCFLEGVLPADAVYGAWFYIPELHQNVANWNLVHFQGGPAQPLRHLWDVTLANADDGSLFLFLRDFVNGDPMGGAAILPEAPPEVPIATWFHIEFRFQRASDATGRVTLYQDDVVVLDLPGIITDVTEFGQWYVGNLIGSFTPPESTIYVDDVTVSAP